MMMMRICTSRHSSGGSGSGSSGGKGSGGKGSGKGKGNISSADSQWRQVLLPPRAVVVVLRL